MPSAHLPPGVDPRLGGLAHQLATLASRVTFDQLSPATRASATARLLDTLGVCLGALDRPAFAAAHRFLDLTGRLPGGAAGRAGPEELLPAREDQVTADTHGFLVGSAAFIDNYADTSLGSVAHPGSVVVPGVLAAARVAPVSGEELITAVVVGYQVADVLGRALNGGTPRMSHQVRGFRPTATCGPAAVAATVGRIWRRDPDEVEQSVLLACNLAAGLRRTDATELAHMRIHSGEAVRRGIEAVHLARAGVALDAQFLEGEGGFLGAMRDGELGPAQVHPASGTAWYLDETAVKLHATPHTLAAALDCVLELVRRDPMVVPRIERIDVRLPAAHAAISLGAAQTDPSTLTAAEALDSLPFCAAVALLTGQIVLPGSVVPFIGDPEAIRLARLVHVSADDELSAVFDTVRASWPVRVDVVVDGRTARLERQHPRGVQLTDDVLADLREKFNALSSPAIHQERQRDLIATVAALESSRDAYADLRSAALGPST